MNGNTICKNRRAVFAAFIALSIGAPAFAALSPLGFGLFVSGKDEYGSNVAVAFPQPEDSVYGFNFSAINGKLDDMYGLCVAGFVMNTENVVGIEVSGIGNLSKNADDGVIQISGLANSIGDSGDGVQIAGFLNCAEDFIGLQVGSINCSEGSCKGVQVGAINVGGGARSGYELKGVQIGCINSADNLKGVQIGACNAVEKSLSGVQIGAFNFIGKSFSGVQIGVINVLVSSDVQILPILRAAF